MVKGQESRNLEGNYVGEATPIQYTIAKITTQSYRK